MRQIWSSTLSTTGRAACDLPHQCRPPGRYINPCLVQTISETHFPARFHLLVEDRVAEPGSAEPVPVIEEVLPAPMFIQEAVLHHFRIPPAPGSAYTCFCILPDPVNPVRRFRITKPVTFLRVRPVAADIAV